MLQKGFVACVLVFLLMCAPVLAMAAPGGSGGAPDRQEGSLPVPEPVDVFESNTFTVDEVGMIPVDADLKDRIDELAGAGIGSVPDDLAVVPLSKRAAVRATSHTEPDDSGAGYNNNVTSAEEIRWDGSVNPVVYDSALGANQPYVDVKWAADSENSAYGSWYADHDFYYVYLEERAAQIDFINITLTGDYGTSHSGDRSWNEFGLEMTILTGYPVINNVEGNQIKSRDVWWSGHGTFAPSLLDTWTDSHGSHWTSMHFSPPYSGDFYVWVYPINMTSTTYGSGVPYTPYPASTKVWYNISVEYVLKTSLNYAIGKSSDDDLKNDDVHTTARPWSGHIDRLGKNPGRDWNLRRTNSSVKSRTDLPINQLYVNEMIDYNDWYNFSADLKFPGDASRQDEVNATIECYDNFVLGVGATQVDQLFFSITYIEVWQHDPVANMYWFTRDWGIGYLLFVDTTTGEPLDWTRPYGHLVCNSTSDLLYVRTWTDLVFWDRASGGIYKAPAFFDVWDAWGFYNFTDCEVKEHIPETAPVLSGGGVSPGLANVTEEFTFNVTYYDINNDPPKSSGGIAVNIDGTLHDMLKNQSPANPLMNDGDYTNGEEYVYTHTYSEGDPKNKEDTHSFSFTAWDETNRQATGDVGVMYGPKVIDDDEPTLVIGWDMPKQVSEDDHNEAPFYFNMSNMYTDLEDPYGLSYAFRQDPADDWESVYDGPVMKLELLDNNTMKWYTKPEENGKVSLYFKATDPRGSSMPTPSPVEFIVKGTPDEPVILSLEYGGADHPVSNNAASVKAKEGEWCNFTVKAFDVDGGDTDLYFSVEATGSHNDVIGTDIVKTAVDAHNFTGDFAFLPLNRHVGEIDVNISVMDDYTKTYVLVTLVVSNTNNPPVLDTLADRKVEQFSYLNLTLTAKDPDLSIPDSTEDLTFACNLSDSIPGLTKGVDWDLDGKTGKFWFHPVDQQIIGFGVDEAEYLVEFRVVDSSGQSSRHTMDITVQDLNEPPVVEDFTVTFSEDDPATLEDEGMTVFVVSPEAVDPDGDEVGYNWDFGVSWSEKDGMERNHTYEEYGEFTITLAVSDDEFMGSNAVFLFKTIELNGDTDDDGMNDAWERYFFGDLSQDADQDYDKDGKTNLEEFEDTTDPLNGFEEEDPKETNKTKKNNDDEEEWLPYAIVAAIALVIIAVVIVIVVLILKKGSDDDDSPEPTSAPELLDEPEPAYAAGLEEPMPMEPDALEPIPEPVALPEPDEAPLELPPGPEEMEIEPEPELGEATPMEPGMEEEAPTPKNADETLCPSCSFPVRPGWFLCPECKNPLG